MTNPSSPLIWVLADDRAGNVSQCLGVAEALGVPFETKKITYNRLTKLPNFLRGSSLLGVDTKKSDALTAPYPDIVIAAGRRTAPIARYIKRQSGGKTKLVQIMWPDFPSGDFDIIAVPEHDNLRHRHNVLPIVGSPSRIRQERLSAEQEQWQPKFANLPAPRIAMLVGGNTKKHRFSPEHASALGEMANALATEAGGSLMVTTSRRTEPESNQALRQAITCPHYFYDWQSSDENPYFGYLACADALIVTGDSMSMCSEAVATGKPVFIFAPDAITSTKHSRLHKHLIELGYAKALTGQFSSWQYDPQNPAFTIAHLIKRQWLGITN